MRLRDVTLNGERQTIIYRSGLQRCYYIGAPGTSDGVLASVDELISYNKFPEGRLESFVSIPLFDFGSGREKYKFEEDPAGSLSTSLCE